MIDLVLPLRLAIADFGEEVTINSVLAMRLMSEVVEGQQSGIVEDYTMMAQVLVEDLPIVEKGQKITRADGTVWRIIHRPRLVHGGWELHLSEEMIRV